MQRTVPLLRRYQLTLFAATAPKTGTSNRNPITLSFDTQHLDSPHSTILEAVSNSKNTQNIESESDYRVELPLPQIEPGIKELFQKHVGSDEPGSLNRDEMETCFVCLRIR